MSLFSFKKSFISSGLLDGMTDIHSHILPEVDDGIKNYEEAVRSLRWLKSNGVRRMYLTPHIMSDFHQNTTAYLTERFDSFLKCLEKDGINDIPELKLGAEYMLEAAFNKHKEEGLLTYADHHVLVETSYMMPPIGFLSLLEDLMDTGYLPILAHPERYIYMDNEDYDALKHIGAKFQLNYLSMTGAYGRLAKEKAADLLKKDYYDYVGSDFHHLPRHLESFAVKSLTSKQIPALQSLFDNNKQLF